MSSSQNSETKRMTSIARKLEWSFIGKKIGLFLGMDLLLFMLFFGGWLVDQEYTRLGGLQPGRRRSFVLAEQETESRLFDGVQTGNSKLRRIVYEVSSIKAEQQTAEEHGAEREGQPTAGGSIIEAQHKEQSEAGGRNMEAEREEQSETADSTIEKQQDTGVRGVRGISQFRVYIYEPFMVICMITSGLFVLQMIGIALAAGHEGKSIRRVLAPIDEIALKADELSRMTFSEDKYQEIEAAISHLQPEETELLSFGDADLQGIEAAMNNLLIRMRDSYRQQARFVNDASHELRTPIAVIEGYANMLSRWGREDEKVLDESITAIQHESEHMKHLVEQLLFLARGDSGKTKLTIEQISLKSLMQEVYEESLMIDEEHRYRFLPPEADVMVQADAMMLKQAVRILVDNAAKYTNKGDEILLSCGVEKGGKPYLQVQDTGIGMAEQDVAHMFERFYRADDARSYQGTGLGLSIAKWIIDKHRGHFEILSRTELGTRIRIYF